MTKLLDIAVEAHGGLDRWRQISSISVAASITGAIWFVKGKGDFLKEVVLTADTKTERLTVDFPGQDKRAIFTPARIVVVKLKCSELPGKNLACGCEPRIEPCHADVLLEHANEKDTMN